MSETATDQKLVSRRRIIQVAGATVLAPAGVGVVAGDTSSGEVELETVATVPTGTSIDITVFEDTSGDSSADQQQTVSIPDGTTTHQLGDLQATANQSDVLWIQVDLSTSDDTVTPSLDSATLTLPAEETTTTTTTPGTTTTTDDGTTTGPIGTGEGPSTPGESQGIGALWQNYRAFIALVVLAFAAIGGWSKSLTIGAFSGYLAFLYLALNSSNQLFRNIALVTLVLAFLGMAFKVVRLEFEGET